MKGTACESEYKALHDEFIRTSAAMLREFENDGGVELEQKISKYVDEVDSARVELESRVKGYFIKQ